MAAPLPRLVLAIDRAMLRVSGPSVRASGLKVGSRTSRTRSGSRPTIRSGNSSSQKRTNAATATITSGSVCVSTPRTRASNAVAAPVTRPRSSRTGANNKSGSSRYSLSAPGRFVRSATRRSERRIRALNAASMAPR